MLDFDLDRLRYWCDDNPIKTILTIFGTLGVLFFGFVFYAHSSQQAATLEAATARIQSFGESGEVIGVYPIPDSLRLRVVMENEAGDRIEVRSRESLYMVGDRWKLQATEDGVVLVDRIKE